MYKIDFNQFDIVNETNKLIDYYVENWVANINGNKLPLTATWSYPVKDYTQVFYNHYSIICMQDYIDRYNRSSCNYVGRNRFSSAAYQNLLTAEKEYDDTLSRFFYLYD